MNPDAPSAHLPPPIRITSPFAIASSPRALLELQLHEEPLEPPELLERPGLPELLELLLREEPLERPDPINAFLTTAVLDAKSLTLKLDKVSSKPILDV